MFCVELARPEDQVRWLRNQEEVVASGRVAITTEGTCHTLTISQCSLEDMGEVAFVAGDCRTSTQFCVSGKDLGSAPCCGRACTGSSCAQQLQGGCRGQLPRLQLCVPQTPNCLQPSFTVVTPSIGKVGVLVAPHLTNQVINRRCTLF